MTRAPAFLHATALVVGEAGVVIEGRSGIGKTSAALALLRYARAAGDFAALVADDRVELEAAGGRLIARPHAAIAGLVERRGLGLMAIAHEPACVVCLVVRLVDPQDLQPRLPEAAPSWTHGPVALPMLVLPGAAGSEVLAGRIVDTLASRSWSGSNDLANSPAMQKIPAQGEAGGQSADRELDGSLR